MYVQELRVRTIFSIISKGVYDFFAFIGVMLLYYQAVEVEPSPPLKPG